MAPKDRSGALPLVDAQRRVCVTSMLAEDPVEASARRETVLRASQPLEFLGPDAPARTAGRPPMRAEAAPQSHARRHESVQRAVSSVAWNHEPHGGLTGSAHKVGSNRHLALPFNRQPNNGL